MEEPFASWSEFNVAVAGAGAALGGLLIVALSVNIQKIAESRGLAARAGASIGSLYQFFPTKYLLAETLHAEQIGMLLESLGELHAKTGGKSAADLADDVFQALTAFLENHPAFVPLADRRDIDKERKAKTRAQLRQRITDLMSHAAPPLPPGKAEIIATVILQLMRSVIALLNDREQPLRDAVLAELRVMLRNHLEKVSG